MKEIQRIHERLLNTGLARSEELVGCSNDELVRLSEFAGRDLPPSYQEFMLCCGHQAGRFLRDVDIFYPSVLSLRPIAEEIVTDFEEFEVALPDWAFVFAMRQKEQFMFFDKEGEEPAIFSYMSGWPAFKKISESFLDVVFSELDQAEASYKLIKGTPYDLYE